jgi:hypothetical protein
MRAIVDHLQRPFKRVSSFLTEPRRAQSPWERRHLACTPSGSDRTCIVRLQARGPDSIVLDSPLSVWETCKFFSIGSQHAS